MRRPTASTPSAYQAITVSYIGATNHRDPRMKAKCAARSMMFQWQDHWNMLENALSAAKSLATNLDWTGAWYVGVVHGGEHVFVNDKFAFHLGDNDYMEQILAAAQAYADVINGDDEQESKERAERIYNALDRFAKL